MKWILLVEDKSDERREYPEFVGVFDSCAEADEWAIAQEDTDERYYTSYPVEPA